MSSPITAAERSDTFEGNVIMDVLDRRFRRVGTTTAQGGTLGAYAPFTTSVAYVISAPQWGYVEAYWPSPKDGSKLDAVTARVHLSPVIAVSPVRATPTPEAVRYHVVRRGETLFSIAARYGVTIRQIVAANGLRNPNRIYVGQRLIIP